MIRQASRQPLALASRLRCTTCLNIGTAGRPVSKQLVRNEHVPRQCLIRSLCLADFGKAQVLRQPSSRDTPGALDVALVDEPSQ